MAPLECGDWARYKGGVIAEKAAGKRVSSPHVEESEEEEEEEEEEEGGLFKFKVLEIRFPVDNGDERPDPSMCELVYGRVWEAVEETGVWEVITEELGWLCEGVCERIVEEGESEVGAAMAAVRLE